MELGVSARIEQVRDRSGGHERLQSLVGRRARLGAVGPDVHAFRDLGGARGLDWELVSTDDRASTETTLESPQRTLGTFLWVKPFRNRIPRGFRRGWWQTNGMLMP